MKATGLGNLLTGTLLCASVITPAGVTAQTRPAIPPQVVTPETLQTSLGTLTFRDGAPSKETVAKVYDNLDLMHGVEAFVKAYQGASVASLIKGFDAAGVPVNTTAFIWSDLIDAKSPRRGTTSPGSREISSRSMSIDVRSCS